MLDEAFELPAARVQLTVLQGTRFAAPAAASGVEVRADVTFRERARGELEIRMKGEDASYGILARAPNIGGALRVGLSGRIPDVDHSQLVELWVHFDESGVDSTHIAIEMAPARGGGSRARVP